MLIAFSGAFIFWLFCRAPLEAQQHENAIDVFNRATIELDLNKKISLYHKVIAIQPDFEEALYNLGITYYRTGQYQQCIESLEKLNNVAFEESKSYLRNAYTFQAEKLLSENRFEDALTFTQNALDIDERYAPAFTLQGSAYLQLFKTAEAVKSLKKAITFNNKQEKAWKKLGDAYLRLEEYPAAINAYQKALAIEPQNKYSAYHLRIATSRNQPDKWLSRYQDSLTAGDSNKSYEIIQNAYHAHPDNQEISDKYSSLQKQRHYHQAKQAMQEKNWTRAESLLAAIEPNFLNTPELLALTRTKKETTGTDTIFITIQPTPQLSLTATNAATSKQQPATKEAQTGPSYPPAVQPEERIAATSNNLNDNPAQNTNLHPDAILSAEFENNLADFKHDNGARNMTAAKSIFVKKPQNVGKNWRPIAASILGLTGLLLLGGRFLHQARKTHPEPTGAITASDQAFIDNVASNTVIQFDPPTGTGQIAGSKPDAKPMDPPTFSEARTRTIIGGIKNVRTIGRYVLENEIGRGAMGLIYKAWDPKLDRNVVIKQVGLANSIAASKRLRARLHREAKAAGKLNHPNIVIVHDVEEDEGTSYIVMEHIPGQNLRQKMDDALNFPPREAFNIILQICSALEFAHAHGIVHRDIKPSNIIICGNIIKVADFGIAQIPELAELTKTGDLVGTPFYMSPEQIKGRKVDGRSDIFSLGIVLYELLTGRRPFTGDSIPAVVYKIVHQALKPASVINKKLNSQIDAILAKAMAKEPMARFESAAEFGRAIQMIKPAGTAV